MLTPHFGRTAGKSYVLLVLAGFLAVSCGDSGPQPARDPASAGDAGLINTMGGMRGAGTPSMGAAPAPGMPGFPVVMPGGSSSAPSVPPSPMGDASAKGLDSVDGLAHVRDAPFSIGDAAFGTSVRDAGATDTALDATQADAAAPSASAQCHKDDDCFLVDDCCSCAALGRNEKAAAPACDPKIACLQTACMEFGSVARPRCEAGRCVLGLDCDTSTVTCRRAAPSCPAGQVPRVIAMAGGRCFGECVSARQCLFVPNCAGCAKDDLCVRTPDAARSVAHCVPRPLTCGTVPSCACVAPAACAGIQAMCVAASDSAREFNCQ